MLQFVPQQIQREKITNLTISFVLVYGNGMQEAYCFTLKKLKEALEEPLKETSSFIEEMYIQLKELCENDSKPNSPPT